MSLHEALPWEPRLARDDLIEILPDVIRDNWSVYTSPRQDWTQHNQAMGHDAISAAVLQDYCGGLVTQYTTGFANTFYNRSLDITGQVIWPDSEVIRDYSLRHRSELIATLPLRLCYEALASSVANYLYRLERSRQHQLERRGWQRYAA